MSSKQTLSIVLVLVGGLILLVGLFMPATQPATTESCIDSTYAQGCVETTYQSPTAKGPIVGLGFMTLFGGAILYVFSDGGDSPKRSDSNSTASRSKSSSSEEMTTTTATRSVSNKDANEGTLLARVQSHRQEDDVATVEPDPPKDTDSSTATVEVSSSEDRESSKGETVVALVESKYSEDTLLGELIRASTIATVGGFAISGLLAILVGSIPGSLAWVIFVLSSLGAVAICRHYPNAPTIQASTEAET